MTGDLPNDQAAARLIRSRRLAMGLSQARLAELVGTSATTVRRWERGESTPSPKALLSLAEALEIAAQELMSPTPDADDEKAAVAPTVVPGTASEPDAAAAEGPAELIMTGGDQIPTGVEAVTASAASSVPVGSVEEIDSRPAPDNTATQRPGPAEPVPQPGEMAASGAPEPSSAAQAGEPESEQPWIEVPTGEKAPVPAGAESDGGDQWVDIPTEQIEPPTAREAAPDSSDEPSTVPRAVPPPSPRPVAVLEPVDYRDDPLQRLRYALRAVLTVVALVAMAVVLVWAVSELWDAIGSVLDLFTEDTIPDVTNGSGQ